MMIDTDTQLSAYIADIAQWRQSMDDRLLADDGWLTLTGLFWLREGINTVGADPSADVWLPAANIPRHLGTIELINGQATLQISADAAVTINNVRVNRATLRDDLAEGGPSLVGIDSVTFFVVHRGEAYGVRVRDTKNPARLTFTGRKWFPLDPNYRVNGTFIPYSTPRILQIVTITGHLTPMSSPGRIEFALHGQPLSLEAFTASENEIWVVFKDKTSGHSTYGAGRFLYARVGADQSVIMDFNKAYHPPCAFTPFATCPLPSKENILAVEIAAGEHL